MSLLDVLRSGVAIVDTVTKPLQANVTYERYAGSNFQGTETYSAAVSLRAIVDGKQHQVRTTSGILSVSRALVIFLDVAALAAATGGLGINDKDKITLPDGTTGPILAVTGFVDAGTGEPLATEVHLG